MSCFVLPTCSSAPHLRGILKTGGQRLTKQQLSSRFVPLSLISLFTLETWLCGRRHAQKEASKKPESLVLIDLESCHTDSVRFIRPSYQCSPSNSSYTHCYCEMGKLHFLFFFFRRRSGMAAALCKNLKVLTANYHKSILTLTSIKCS